MGGGPESTGARMGGCGFEFGFGEGGGGEEGGGWVVEAVRGGDRKEVDGKGRLGLLFTYTAGVWMLLMVDFCRMGMNRNEERISHPGVREVLRAFLAAAYGARAVRKKV